MNQRQLQQRGARTVLFTPEEHRCLFSVASEGAPVELIPLVGFKVGEKTANQFREAGLALHQCNANAKRINTVELGKLQQQAQRDKPQRADQLPQETVFELTKEDGCQEFYRPARNFVVGADCLRIEPDEGFAIHRLFLQGGVLNTQVPAMKEPSAQVCVELLAVFIEAGALEAIKKAKPQHLLQQAQETEIEAGRPYVAQENQKLFSKKRNLDVSCFPLDFGQYILAVSVPEELDGRYLRMLEEAVIERLGFAGIQVFTQGMLWNSYGPVRSSGALCLDLGMRQGRMRAFEPHLPVVSKISVVAHSTALSVLQALIYYIRGVPELKTLAQLFCRSYRDLGELQFLPRNIGTQYGALPSDVQEAILMNLQYQLEYQLVAILEQCAVSLQINDNKQATVQLLFPMSKQGLKISFCLGWAGLAAARVVFSTAAVALPFCSQSLQQQIIYHADISAEHKEGAKATKVQISPEEMAPIAALDRKLLDDIQLDEAGNPKQTYAGLLRVDLEDLVVVLAQNIYENTRRNEIFLRETGKGQGEGLKLVQEGGEDAGSQALTEATNQQSANLTEEQVGLNLVKTLLGSVAPIGVVANEIPGFREALVQRVAPKLLVAFPQERGIEFRFLSDPLVDSGSKECWLRKQHTLLQLTAISDGGIDSAVAKEELQAIGDRIWIERGPFPYPQ